MESTSVPSAVQATDEFYSALPGVLQALFEERKVDVKGKGTMKTWLLDVAAKERECAQLGELAGAVLA